MKTDLKKEVVIINGKMTAPERDQAIELFRKGVKKLLITSDLMARGFDVYQVSLIINFDLPNTFPKYVHRLGRCGRFGRKGLALNIILPSELQFMKSIEAFFNT